MTKTELIKSVALQSGFTKADTGKVINLALDTIKQNVKESGRVALECFGTFAVVQRAARVGRNPRTKESVAIPPTKVVRFKASSIFQVE